MQNIRLEHPAGSSAEILVDLGFNCHKFSAPVDGENVPIVWSEEGFAEGGKRPSGRGIPLLFPFPGRIGGTTFQWEGRSFELTAGDGQGNAIHGFVLDRPWRLLEQTATRAVAEFHASVDDPALADMWPADFRLTVAYELGAAELSLEVTIENPDHHPLPCGLGLHPYFQLPLGGDATNAEHCIVHLPVTKNWELENMLLTGRCADIFNAAEFQAGLRFGDMQFDNVFSGLQFQGDVCHAAITDPQAKRKVSISFDRLFRECVVYTPPHRRAVCIEPYTCTPDPFRLAREGMDGGLKILQPGQKYTGRFQISVASCR